MRFAIFCHSLLSDWNHGNAHFLRGVASELSRQGHEVRVYEPQDAWSVQNLVADHGESALEAARGAFPHLSPTRYEEASLDVEAAVDGCAAVLVHEWNSVELVRRVGDCRRRGGRFALLFHDTHHRSVTQPEAIARYDLAHYDGVLAFGESVRQKYAERGWGARAWTWHEAADTATFRPLPAPEAPAGDVVWIGNWGDEERTVELAEYLLHPAGALGLRGSVFGVRYPDAAKRELAKSGLRYRGWLPNFRVPEELAAHSFAVHVPRRPYAAALPGIPTIRVFETLACAAPLICAPWDDSEGLFSPGQDYLVAESGRGMQRVMRDLVNDQALRRELGARGRATILSKHTCAHRVSELFAILATITGAAASKGGDRRHDGRDASAPEATTPEKTRGVRA